MKKPNLPLVTEETIREVVAAALEDKNKLYQDIAALNPFLYQFVVGCYQLPDTNKDTMLGMFVATYHCLEQQTEKDRQKRARRGRK